MELEEARQLLKQYTSNHNTFVSAAKEAKKYYENDTDILRHGAVNRRESPDPMRSADNRIPSNFHGLLVNQVAAYLFTDPPIFDIGSQEANQTLQEVLGDKFPKFCTQMSVNASNCRVAWAHVWKADDNTVQYAAIDPIQCIPVYTDNLDPKLKALMRSYGELQDDGKGYDVVEIWTDTECATFKRKGSSFRGLEPYFCFSAVDTGEPTNILRHNYGFVPFVPFYNNSIPENDLKNIKALIDCYDKVFSGFLNDLEDIQEVIFVLAGYSGTDLNEFLDGIKKYKTVKIDEAGEGGGGLSTLTIQIPVEAREKMLTMTRKAIFEQGQGIDPDPQNFGNSSGVALGYLYSLLELKAGFKETEFRLGFATMIRYICQLAGITVKTIQQTWTRTSVTNDQELAGIAANSVGIISDETILRRHPWVDDPLKEKERLEAQREKEAEIYQNSFGKGINQGGAKNGSEDEE